MKKKLGTFRRTARKDYMNYLVIILVCFLGFLAFVFGYKVSEASTIMDLKRVLEETFRIGKSFFMDWSMTFVIVINATPPDFQYDIIVDEDNNIIFNFPNGSKVISRYFVISKKKIHRLVLEDEENKKK